MERNQNTHNLLEIKDITIAAYLYASNQTSLVGIKRISDREVIFQFSPKAKAEELIMAYWNMKALIIQPKQLFTALRDLKDIIFSG